jgi:hypothetical protein
MEAQAIAPAKYAGMLRGRHAQRLTINAPLHALRSFALALPFAAKKYAIHHNLCMKT